MARTTSAAVILILPSECDVTIEESTVDPFVEAASAIVDDVNTCATARGSTLSSTRLELIERYVAAHLYRVLVDQGAREEETADAKIVYEGSTAMMLDATFYGQTAKMLDSTGCLAAQSNQKRISISWLGLPPSSQTDYDDRD